MIIPMPNAMTSLSMQRKLKRIFRIYLINQQYPYRCQLRNIIHNKKYLMKFDLNELKNNESCERNKHQCDNNEIIGPIISKDIVNEGNSLFFISLLEKKLFSLTDYSYKVSNDTKLKGHIFALFPYNEIHKETFPLASSNSNIIYNIKQFRNIGSELDEAKILPGMHYHNIPIQNGIMLKYINGDNCIGDNSKNTSAYIIMNCDSTGGVYLSPQLTFVSKDKCTFVFEWNNRFGCPTCLKQDLVPIYEGCFNGNKRAHYFENLNCVISKENTSEYTNRTDSVVEYNNEDNILHYDNIDKIVLSYLLTKYDLTEDQLKKDFKLSNIVLNASLVNEQNKDIYVESRIQQIPCSKIKKSLQSSYFEGVIIMAIVIAYAILILCLVYLFCQYQRVSKEYTRLKQSDTFNTTDNYPNTEIELTNI